MERVLNWTVILVCIRPPKEKKRTSFSVKRGSHWFFGIDQFRSLSISSLSFFHFPSQFSSFFFLFLSLGSGGEFERRWIHPSFPIPRNHFGGELRENLNFSSNSTSGCLRYKSFTRMEIDSIECVSSSDGMEDEWPNRL